MTRGSSGRGADGAGVDAIAELVKRGDRGTLARAVTLVESRAARHQDRARAVLDALLPATGGAIRVGVTGPPGVGKSCLIEALGLHLLEAGRRVAVLAVDPSSTVSGGSILGDKTRMPQLANHPQAFVRPSPSAGSLGGVARRTREVMLLCEAAGFDVVIVETVGVGQSEAAVRGMVDFFLLLVQAGAGDELQGVKRGVVELADAIAVTKADGDNAARAERARGDYAAALQFLTSPTEGWQVEVVSCSAVTGAGIPELWRIVEAQRELGLRTGTLPERRRRQALEWMHDVIRDALQRRFYAAAEVRRQLPEVEREVLAGQALPVVAAQRLLDLEQGGEGGGGS